MIKNAPVKTLPKITKHHALLKLLHRNRGATLDQMKNATGWQPHSVRGFLSGTVKKRLGLKLNSETDKNGERRYAIAKS